MGQRLPGLSQDWARLVIEGDEKKHAGAAAIRAQGTDALVRGIREGTASFTAQRLRKKEMAKEERRYAQEFALRKEEAQYRKDEHETNRLLKVLQALPSEMDYQPISGPDGSVLSEGDPQAASRVRETREQVMRQLGVTTQRMEQMKAATSQAPT